jgi:transposase
MKCFRMRGTKSDEQFDPADPPRRRAHQRRGRGTYANERPPILGTVGREPGQVRLCVVTHTQGQTWREQVHQGSGMGTPVYTDEDDRSNHLERPHSTVSHSHTEWARDDDGDGLREVQTNTTQGKWTGLRTFRRPFRGVHKRFVSGYVAVHEFRVNLKAMSVSFIAALVALL